MSEKKEDSSEEKLLFPYYIDQARLLDVYAALNGGYSAYEEITTEFSDRSKKSGKGRVTAGGGFRLLKIGAEASGGIEADSSDGGKFVERRVQTPASMLSIIDEELRCRGFISPIAMSRPGSFVIEPVTLQINSLKSMMAEIEQLQSLSIKMQGLSKDSNNGGAKKDQEKVLKQIQEISRVVKELVSSEEIICQKDELALVGTISDSNLYQANRGDIVETDLVCLAQVRRVHKNGAQLLRNTIFSKMQDVDSKKQMIDALGEMVENDAYDYEATVIPAITDKPVYEIEIIALFQEAEANSINS